MKSSKITICFYQRRYDDFNSRSNFLELMFRQNHWVNQLDKNSYEVFFILGAKENKIIESRIGNIILVQDRPRKSRFHHSLDFYMETARIIQQNKTNLLVCQGLNDVVSHALLCKYLDSGLKVIYQDHASSYGRKQLLFRYFFKAADCITFNSPGQEASWVQNKIFSKAKVKFITEGTSLFTVDLQMRNQNLKRYSVKRLLWVGDLNENKDPITILKALSLLSGSTNYILTMIYRNYPLLEQVKDSIKRFALTDRIRLVGNVNHVEMQEYFKSHHYIISGSGKEGSGYSVIEAMSCGMVPILTKIPSFDHFTNYGRVGFRFNRGDFKTLAEKIDDALDSNYDDLSRKAFQHYQEHFSPLAIASKLICIHHELVSN